jgi:hypothetical protein
VPDSADCVFLSSRLWVPLPQAIGAKKIIVGVSLAQHDCCVKVIGNSAALERESKILQIVHRSFNGMYPDRLFYLLGTHRLQESLDESLP